MRVSFCRVNSCLNWRLIVIPLFVVLISSCHSGYQRHALISPVSQIEPAQVDADVIKGKSDPAHYRTMQLGNGLKLLLVSDPELVKAYGSLSVQAGYFQDPKSIAGLAHLYEHMLSKGSSKYPQTAEYKQFLADHGGRSNASTRSNSSNYYFQVAESNFAAALDRFAWQFIDPLLPHEFAYKERHAVEAEFSLKFSDAFRRKRETLRQMINPEHPYSQFSTGNLNTLHDTPSINLAQSLVDFGRDYYCAPRMAVVLAAPLSLDQLAELGRTKFAAVPTQCRQPLVASPKAFISPPNGKVLNIKTLKKRSRITLSFTVPNMLATRNSLSAEYIEWLFESPNTGGLQQYLKDRDLIQNLYASSSSLDELHDLFNIEFKLTSKGWRQPDLILAATFDYIDFLRQKAISDEAFSGFELLQEANFNRNSRHKSADDIRQLANQFLFEPTAQVLSAGRVASHFSSDEIQQWLAPLTVKNMLVIRESRKLAGTQVEPIYQTEYSTDKPIVWHQNKPALIFKLPEHSPYFAKLAPITVPDWSQPTLLLQQPSLTAWYLPKAVANDSYSAITVYLDTDKQSLATDFDYLNPLRVKRLKEQLESVLDAADQANIEVNLSTTRQGMKLAVSGRGGNWIKLMADILAVVAQPQLTQTQLNDSLESYIRTLQGQSKDRLRSQTLQLLNDRLGLSVTTADSLAYFDCVNKKRVDFEQKTDCFAETKYAQFNQDYLQRAHISAFYYGHLQAQQWQSIDQSLQTLVSQINQPINGAIDRWDGTTVKSLQQPVKPFLLATQDSAVRLILLAKDQSLFSAANTELLGAMITAPFFHQLRTEEQLGYSVSASAKVSYAQPMLSYYVQSPVMKAKQLINRIEHFNQWYLGYLTDMPAAQFAQVKQNLAMAMLQPSINSASAEAQLRYNIRKGRSLDYDQQLQQQVKSMPQADFLHFAKQLLNQPLQGVSVDPIIEKNSQN